MHQTIRDYNLSNTSTDVLKTHSALCIQGFSLVELMMAVTIIGILTAIAYPSYTSYVLKSHRADAMTTLSQDQIRLERCYAQNTSYNGACTALPAFPQTSTQGFYTINISNLSPSTYTLTATPIGNQIKDNDCASIAVTQANVKTAVDGSGTAQARCWNG